MNVIQAMDHQVYVVKELSAPMFSDHTIVIVNQVINSNKINVKQMNTDLFPFYRIYR